jgi:KUP system potassium uptake protein
MMIGALGVVFGDIGTSPLYTIQLSFSKQIGLGVSPENVLGVLSLIFWLLIIVVTGQYITFVLRADNKGEGGVLSLHALALRTTTKFKLRRAFIIIGLLGAGLFYGDSIITPAISVLSAVEGLQIAMPHISHMVLPITIVILIVLFSVQKHGTAFIGKFFGPVILIWFVAIGLLGLHAIIKNPFVIQAINPYHAVHFAMTHGVMTLMILGAVMLAVTGSEAIYVDIGHFGRKPIQRAWYFIALPTLLLNYFGQGALLLMRPEAVDNPFFRMAPEFLQIPLVLLATAATVIASQATISGAYSITRQAMRMGYLPRMEVTHTSEHEAGQIYIPTVNTLLMVAVILLVLTFQSSANLAAAYGISVIGTMIMTTILAYQVTNKIWGWSAWWSAAAAIPLLFIYACLISANLLKIPEGGWATLLVASFVIMVMITWLDGSQYLLRQISNNTLPLKDFVASVRKLMPLRVAGTAIYLVRTAGDAPHALVRNFQHNHIIHERVIVLHIATRDVPRINRAERCTVTDMGDGFMQLEARYGFMEFPSVPLLLRQCVDFKVIDLDMGTTNFLVSHVTLIPDAHVGMPLWQAILFKWLYINSIRAHDFYRIPTNKALEIGIQMRI